MLLLFHEVEQKRDSVPRNTVYFKVGLHVFSKGGSCPNTVIVQSEVFQARSLL